MSFVKAIAASKANNIFLIRAVEGGRPCYFYMLIRQEHARNIAELVAKGSVDLANYGTVLASGYGENPPEDVQQRMHDEYQFEE